ncbi:GntR family transcriptional regulator [Desemzia incerta]|uniref:GntR family transcriptional regulator n=1 Tax=Desemzia incerta TaxID=82801 RepID=UPI0016610E09|nr:GntR family transcriptional regulator [Desemzia incerta]
MQKYLFIYNDMKNRILNGEFVANEKLPFEKDLCISYNTSKMTIKKAFDLLVEDGLIIKKRGVGTFIKDINSKEMERLIVTSQFQGLTSTNPKNKITSKILKFNIIPADSDIERQLNLTPDSFVYDIHRVRYTNGQPTVIEQTYMPIDLVVGLNKTHLKNSLYKYIEEELNYKIQSAHRRVSVRKATEEEAQNLELQVGDPVAVAEQVAYFDNGRAFEYSFSVHHYNFYSAQFIVTK